MPPTNFLRELSAAGLTLEPEPAAKVEIALGSRTLILCAFPWSVRVVRAERLTLRMDAAPPEPVEPCDLLTEIAALAKNAEQTPVPLVADGPCLRTERLQGGTPDAAEWGFGRPDSARRRAQRAWDLHYADALHFLAEDVATFTAAIVAHHLSPSPQTAREVRLCGVRAAGQIVAMVKRVSP